MLSRIGEYWHFFLTCLVSHFMCVRRVVCAYVCVVEHRAKVCRGCKRTLSVLLCPCPSYSFETGFLTEGTVRLAACTAQGSSCFSPRNTGVTGLKKQARFYYLFFALQKFWGSKLWFSCWLSNGFYPLIHVPNPRTQNSNLINYKSILKSFFYTLYVLPLPTPTESILFSL